MNAPVTLYVGYAPLGVIDERVFALLADHDQAAQWVITPVRQHGENAVIIQSHDRATGMLMPDQEPGTQVAVRPLIAGHSYPPTYPPNEVWTVTPLTGQAAPGLEPDTAAFTLHPHSAGPDQYIGRRRVEELSMLPKRIVLLADGTEPTPFIAIPDPDR
jgi:hypothetical protein